MQRRLRYTVLVIAALAWTSGAGEGAATSNDLQKIETRWVAENRELTERVKKLEAQVERLERVVGERRGSEGFDSMAKDLRNLDRQVEDLEREVKRLSDAVARGGRR